jgi:hypothetical protein
MFSHPVSQFGYIAIAVGIVLVLVSNGIGYGTGALLYLCGVVLLGAGPFLILIGVIAQGFLRIEGYLSGVVDMKAAFEAAFPAQGIQAAAAGVTDVGTPFASDEKELEPAEDLRRRMMEHGFKQ